MSSDGIILHWDGSAWSVNVANPAQRLFAVWGSGTSDVWAVGGETIEAVSDVLHWDSSAWSSSASGLTEVNLAWHMGQRRGRTSGLWAPGGVTLNRL